MTRPPAIRNMVRPPLVRDGALSGAALGYDTRAVARRQRKCGPHSCATPAARQRFAIRSTLPDVGSVPHAPDIGYNDARAPTPYSKGSICQGLAGVDSWSL